MSFTLPFLLGTVFFRTALACSGGYHMGRGGMPLHDAVGIKGKKVKSSMAKSLPVENLLPQNVGSIINYLQ